MQVKVKTYTVSQAKSILERYCLYQERCHKEVVSKLRQMRMIPQAIDVIVVHLIENGYLNEERFACSFSRGKFRHKKWGRVRITNELKYRGISAYNIRIALQEIQEDYQESFLQLSRRKYESIKETNYQKARKKLADFLLYKGWESDMVYQRVNELYPY